MQPDSPTSEIRVGDWLRPQARHADPLSPDWALNQETMSLPAFLTGSPAPAPAPAPSSVENPDKLPSSERNMLIFVALLLLSGTVAIVAMSMFG
jgi:hypothetical protein